jgi:Stress responsive A/B Barrel Domain
MRDQEMRAVIFHINRASLKPGLSPEQREAGLDLLRQAGAANPAVRSFVVGPELGGDFEWGAGYVVEDLDGYWEYLTHPAHIRAEMEGMEFIERFEAFDITDSDDAEIGGKIARLQARNYEEHPELAALVAQVPSFRVPGGEV